MKKYHSTMLFFLAMSSVLPIAHNSDFNFGRKNRLKLYSDFSLNEQHVKNHYRGRKIPRSQRRK